jgi:hypothetical protein
MHTHTDRHTHKYTQTHLNHPNIQLFIEQKVPTKDLAQGSVSERGS